MAKIKKQRAVKAEGLTVLLGLLSFILVELLHNQAEEGKMQIKAWGTRGSVPIANAQSTKYGGNTTCLQITSGCLPKGMMLLIDAGSGIVPVEMAGVKDVLLLMTHHHHDHTLGLPLWGTTFNKNVPIHVVGPVQERWGPEDIFRLIMQRPVFPVSFEMVSSHFVFYPLLAPASVVLIIHPIGGFQVLKLFKFERRPQKVSFGTNGSFPTNECLVVFMHQTVHPEATISYRFEERPTGKVFCFLTDHENQDGIPISLRKHLVKADLMIEDAQYDRETYDRFTAGFGHGTPDYAVQLANVVGARRLGLTHHDPRSDDAKVEAIVDEARRCAQTAIEFLIESVELESSVEERCRALLQPEDIFACADYMEIEV